MFGCVCVRVSSGQTHIKGLHDAAVGSRATISAAAACRRRPARCLPSSTCHLPAVDLLPTNLQRRDRVSRCRLSSSGPRTNCSRNPATVRDPTTGLRAADTHAAASLVCHASRTSIIQYLVERTFSSSEAMCRRARGASNSSVRRPQA